MIEIDEPEFNVDGLAAAMRDESLRFQARKRAGHPSIDSAAAADDHGATTDAASSSHAGSSPVSPITQASLGLQPPFQPRADHQYHVKDLLQYHDRSFVQNAYRAILKRGPDATGFKDFIEALRSGRLNKIDILARLRYSSEGRAKKVRVKGLFLPAAIRQGYRVPVLGYLMHLFVALARLPSTMRSQQQFEAHVLAQHEQLADYANALKANLATHSAEVSAALARLNASAQASARQQQRMRDELNARLDEYGRRFETRLAEELDAARQRLELLETRLASEGSARNEQVGMLTRSLGAEAAQLRRELELASVRLRAGTEEALEKQQQLRAELVLHGQRVTRLLEEAGAVLNAPVGPEREAPLRGLADEDHHSLDAFYLSFEDQFRGSRAEIKERLKVYLPLLEEAGIGTEEMSVLDLGSGRGEWLELLQERGLIARGVDQNRVLVAECRERGLDAVEEDVMRYLRALPDASLGAVTGFHLVEHLPIETLVKMMDETVRLLKPGGLVLFETPNPQNVLVGSCNFYYDPTHRNPLPSPILRFLVESRGFARVEVLDLNPSDAERVEGESDLVKRFNQYFYGPMDYAVIGRKV